MNNILLHRLNSSMLLSPEEKWKICSSRINLNELFEMKEEEAGKYLSKFDVFLQKEKVNSILCDATKRKAEESLDKINRGKCKLLSAFEKEYPDKLRNIYTPPICLYYIGRLPEKNVKTVAIVGARSCTGYGVKYAGVFGKELSERNIQIVSGMARGIDFYAGQASVKRNCFGILGSGPDVLYPESSRELYEALCREGGVISELVPGTKPEAINFPRRNRLISAFSDVIFLVEAKYRSGALITVNYGLEQGKDICVLPGRADDFMSQGCLDMIKSGAIPVTSPEDIISIF